MKRFVEVLKLDLHMHTTVSDGTDKPEEILKSVKEAGIELFSVTDHDAVKGCRIIRKLRTEEDPMFITGVEFSCKDENGKYHILGYDYDPDSEPIRKIIALGHGYRMKKVLARLDFLKTKFRFDFLDEDIKKLLALDNPGKPHIGNLMVKYGFADSKETAINRYINQIKFKMEYVRPEEAITSIIAGGGIPVLAHPSYGSGDQLILGKDMDDRIRRLMDFGLQGIEAFYSGFTQKISNEVLSFAEKYDLYVTAGSDYHGLNKLVPLGDTGLFSNSEYPEGLKKFLEELDNRRH